MDDLSICKRIAEIEGFDFTEFENSIVKITTKKVTMNCFYKDLSDHVKVMYNKNNIYNPLTDDALCFRLMIKYRVEVDYDICRVSTWHAKYQAQPIIDLTFKSKVGDSVELINSIELNRAICLVIIRANKDV